MFITFPLWQFSEWSITVDDLAKPGETPTPAVVLRSADKMTHISISVSGASVPIARALADALLEAAQRSQPPSEPKVGDIVFAPNGGTGTLRQVITLADGSRLAEVDGVKELYRFDDLETTPF